MASLDQAPFSALSLQQQVLLEAGDIGSLLVPTVEPGTACGGGGTEDDERICVSGRSQLKNQTRQTPRLRWKCTRVAEKRTLWETGVKGGATGTFPEPGLCARPQEAPEDDSAAQLRPQQRPGSPGQSPSARSPSANPLPAPSPSSSHIGHGGLRSTAPLPADWGEITNTLPVGA